MVAPVVVITGGASGIGMACAKKYLQQKATVYILDIKKPDFDGAQYIACDMRKLDTIKNAIEYVFSKSGRIDILIPSAGIHLSKTLDQTSQQDFFNVLNINFVGTFFILKAALPIMMKQKKGSIVLVGSDQSLIGKTNASIYGASKAALGQLAKSTALDYAQYNIRVNAVCPGTIDTPLYRHAIEKYSKKSGIPLAEIEAEEAALQPINKVGAAEEVANTIYFIASDDSSFTTGALIAVDGGYTAR